MVYLYREIYLDGNDLRAEGVILLLNELCQGAELEAQERLDQKQLKEEQEAAQAKTGKFRNSLIIKDLPHDFYCF